MTALWTLNPKYSRIERDSPNKQNESDLYFLSNARSFWKSLSSIIFYRVSHRLQHTYRLRLNYKYNSRWNSRRRHLTFHFSGNFSSCETTIYLTFIIGCHANLESDTCNSRKKNSCQLIPNVVDIQWSKKNYVTQLKTDYCFVAVMTTTKSALNFVTLLCYIEHPSLIPPCSLS